MTFAPMTGGRPTALVTGAGRGIGRSCALAFRRAGWEAVAGVRDVAAAEEAYRGAGVLVAPLDVADPAEVRAGVAAAEAHAGGALGAVVLNAGYGVLGAVEDVDLDEVRAMFEVNLFGAAAVLQAALPAMREGGGGAVVVVSSIGARIANPLLGMYHASKYGLLALAEALALEGRPFGIRVSTIEPGMVDTDFPRAVRATGAAANGEGPYAPLLAAMRSGFAAWRRVHPTGADEVGEAVVAAALDPDPPFRVPVGDDARRLGAMREVAADDRAFHQGLVDFLGLDWPAPPSR
jgi:NAD(P)-dependent dehydrogenase (short-subunit alcohol dehydrogenase family)